MIEDFLKDIYEKSMSLELLKEASFYSSIRHAFNRQDFWNEVTDYLEMIIYDQRDKDIKKAVKLMESAQKAKQFFGDIHAFSGIIDTEIIPKLMEYMEDYTGINVSDDKWTLESTPTGFLTIRKNDGLYLHSTSDPMWESFLYAYSIYDPIVKRYHILGAGLGYLAYQLWRMSGGEADIYVFEVDPDLSVYSDLYGVISLIDDDKIHYVTGDDTDIILEKFFEDSDIEIVRTISYWNIKEYEGPYADTLRVMMTNEVTTIACGDMWKRNFATNMSSEHGSFSELDPNMYKDEWVVVGAGPSLNENEEFIRDSIGKRTICAVNSSFKWFYIHDIKPDMCAACDPCDMLVPHIEGFEAFSEDVPLVADYVANRKYLELYRGPKYFVYSNAAEKLSEDEVSEKDVWSFGGTVTSMGLEIALRLGAKKVYLIGADLSYPGGVTYADGVIHEVGKCSQTGEAVVSMDDIWIPTSILFREYRVMMENQIAAHPTVEIVNRSFHGAYIKGTYCGKWWETLPIGDGFADYQSCFENLQKDSLILGWKEKYYLFWQLLDRIQTKGIELNENETGVIENAYDGIYKAFKDDLNWENVIGSKKIKGQTYIFTKEFKNSTDPEALSVLKRAKKEVMNNRKVLIVNTAEKLGGEKVAVRNGATKRYNYELETADKVSYDKLSIPYFQFPNGMPDLDNYKVFLSSIEKSVPEKVVVYGKYSLLADFCSEIFGTKKEILE